MIPTRTFIVLAVLSMAAQLMAGDGYIIRKNQRTLNQIQRFYSEMPPVCYTPPSDQWRNLPETKKLLTEGERLRVVMLGDSIVNDTSRSCWNLLLEQHYPKCRIIKTTSVRGSTGCWWYKDDDRLKKYELFLPHPSLLVYHCKLIRVNSGLSVLASIKKNKCHLPIAC